MALLKGLEVSDEDIFKALDFGLTPAEKEVRMGWQKTQKENMGKSTKQPPTQIEIYTRANDFKENGDYP